MTRLLKVDPSGYPIRGDWLEFPQAIAWIAFGKAVPYELWDDVLYIGATLWVQKTPSEIVWLLKTISDGKTELSTDNPTFFSSFHLHSTLTSAPLNSNGDYDEQDVRKAALEIAEGLAQKMGRANEIYELITSAMGKLRKELARGNLTAYAYPRIIQDPTSARIPVPADVFAAPVTLCEAGIVPFVIGDCRMPIYPRLIVMFEDALIASDDVLRIWPEQVAPTEDEWTTPARPTDADLIKFYFGRVKEWGDRKPPSEKEDLAAIKSQFGDRVSRQDLRHIRRRYAPPEWLKRGPRESRGNSADTSANPRNCQEEADIA